MIKVPFMKMPKCCDECPFARLKYSRPQTDGRQGYNCQVEYYEKGKYETVREAPYDEHVVPVKCPLVNDEDTESVKDLFLSEIIDTGAYEQEVNGKTEFLKGIDYCLSVIDKYKVDREDKI